MSDRKTDSTTELEELLAIAREHDLDAMLVEEGDFRVELVRRDPQPVAAVAPEVPVAAPVSALESTADAPADPVPAGEAVTAPIVGVFYRSPSPGAAAFVNVGDRVQAGQTLCILEAMKLMNEITAEISGIVTAIGPENGDLVTIGQPLFHIS